MQLAYYYLISLFSIQIKKDCYPCDTYKASRCTVTVAFWGVFLSCQRSAAVKLLHCFVLRLLEHHWHSSRMCKCVGERERERERCIESENVRGVFHAQYICPSQFTTTNHHLIPPCTSFFLFPIHTSSSMSVHLQPLCPRVLILRHILRGKHVLPSRRDITFQAVPPHGQLFLL